MNKQKTKKIFFKLLFFGSLILVFLVPYSISIHDNLMMAESAEASVIDDDLKSIGVEINKTRQNLGLSELYFSAKLSNLAEIRIIDMAHQKYIDHVNPQGSSLEYFSSKVGYNYLLIGENLAIDYRDPEEMVIAWLNSPAHRDNLLKPEYTEMGLSRGLVKTSGGEKYVIALILGKEKTLSFRQLIAR